MHWKIGLSVLVVVAIGIGAAFHLRTGSVGLREIHVQCKTSKGELEIVVKPDWSPLGAQRFLQMVDDGFFTELPLFRCVDGFLCQFGANFLAKTYPPIADDPPIPDLRQFKRGYLSFAGSGPNSRATHLFIALGEAQSLGSQTWETPIGFVTPETFTSTASHFTTRYGDMAPYGGGPDSRKIEAAGGRDYLKANFPELDYIGSCARRK